jgi:hypothetical protein
MMRFKALPEPAGFAAAVKASKDEIAKQIKAKQPPDFTGREKWKDFKKDMAAATFGKCGYCEVDVWTVDRFKGDVEHYRPKGRIDVSVKQPDGSVATTVQFASGYYWLAYEWTNYVLTCNPCNSAHKKNLFPVKAMLAAAPVEGSEANEVPLLMSPFGRRDPLKHLLFDEFGVVGPRGVSEFGSQTIAVCGLDRGPLRKKRAKLAKLVRRQLMVLTDPAANREAVQLALDTIAGMGSADMEHAGMVRAMFTDATGHPWSFVERASPSAPPTFEP